MIALQPISQYLDHLLTYTHAYTRTTRANPTTPTPTVSRLWLKLAFAPVNIVLVALEDPEPTGTDDKPKLATHDWLLNNLPALEPEPLDEPVNIIDLAKARQRRQLIEARQEAYEHSKGQHLHPRQRAVVQALIDVGFVYITGFDEFDLHGVRIGGFGISEEFEGGYWIAVQHLESLDTWGFDPSEDNPMDIMTAVDIIGNAIQRWDTKDQLPLPEPEPELMPADYIPPIPEDAFIIAGSKGKFAIAESDGGHLVGRWVNQKKGEKFTRHFIPTDGQCDCKAAQLGKNCCHSKALDHYQYQKKEQARIERERERDRLETLNRNRYQVITGTDTDAGTFSSELHAIAKLEVLSYQGFDVKIYDQIEDEIIRSYKQPRIATA